MKGERYYAYCTIFSSLIITVIAAILHNPDFTFITVTIMFSYLALDTLSLCFEMVMLTFFSKKSLGDE